jgi:hypothetical protein
VKFINVDGKYPDNEFWTDYSEEYRAEIIEMFEKNRPQVGEFIFLDTTYEVINVCLNLNHKCLWYYLKQRIGYTP